MNHVEAIKERLDIVQVVGSYIKLDKSGKNMKARCPFHNEKTPSFYVSPDRGSYYCFGCGAKGDIFTFVEKFEGIDFMGALKVLADKAGVVLGKAEFGKDNRKETLYDIMEKATSFFESKLEENETSKNYILGRGLSESTLKQFRVGFAPADWRQLRAHLKSKGYRDEDVAAVGLIKKTDKVSDRAGSDPYYDVFRGRIMFPISDTAGRIIAFSGRTLDEQANPPKYLNSPETVIFTKSKALYGLDKAKADIRKRDYSILVEGQMDLVMSHQAGFTNTVAASGTAFTDDDGTDSAFGLLTRLSDNIVLAFDSDAAGQKAIKRIVPAISLGMNVKVVDIKGGKDPADIIKANPKDWVKTLESKKDFVEFLSDTLVDSKASPAVIAKQVKSEIFPYVRFISDDTPRFQAIKKIADKLSISEDALWKDLQEYVRKERMNERGKAGETSRNVQEKIKSLSRLESIERKIIGLLYSDQFFKADAEKVKELESVVGQERLKIFTSLSPADIAELTLEAEVTYAGFAAKDVSKEWAILLLHLEEEYVKKKFEELMAHVHKTEKNKGETETLMKEMSVVTKRLEVIKSKLRSI